jgi:hypothetical protein
METNQKLQRPVTLQLRDRRTGHYCFTTIWVEATDPRSDEQIRDAFKLKRKLSLEHQAAINKATKLSKAFGPDWVPSPRVYPAEINIDQPSFTGLTAD